MKICEYCNGQLDRPGLYDCTEGHVEPDLAQRIVAAIERDFKGRRCLRQEWEEIDDDIQVEIRDAWADLIRAELNKRKD